jgi:hypothetical protein
VRPQHWPFLNRSMNQPLACSTIQRNCRHARDRTSNGKPATPHALRHVIATRLRESGTDVRTIQLLLDPHSLSTTSIYTRVSATNVCSTPSPSHRLPIETREYNSMYSCPRISTRAPATCLAPVVVQARLGIRSLMRPGWFVARPPFPIGAEEHRDQCPNAKTPTFW